MKWNYIDWSEAIFQKVLQSITWKNTGLNGFVYNCTVDYSIDVSDIVDIHKYLMNDQIYLTSFYYIIKF